MEEEFTPEEKHKNFLKILETNQYLDGNGRVTEDWVEEHKKLILQYREWIPDYSRINEEIEGPAFRKICSQTETLLSQLYHSIVTTGTFNVRVYHIFIRHMKQILDEVFTDDQMAELLSMLNM